MIFHDEIKKLYKDARKAKDAYELNLALPHIEPIKEGIKKAAIEGKDYFIYTFPEGFSIEAMYVVINHFDEFRVNNFHILNRKLIFHWDE